LISSYFAVLEWKKKKAAALTIRCSIGVFKAKAHVRMLKEKELDMMRELEFKKQRNQAINDKGLIRAFCRIKPFLGNEIANQKSAVKVVDGSNTLLLLDPQGRRSEAYLLDRVFLPDSSQEEIYEQVEDLVENAIDGNHVCLMAYGQTGSGKSYTMEGTGENPGLIPRAAAKLFDGSRAKEGWQFSYKISSFQIYQNEVEDLLVPGSKPVIREMRANGKSSVEIRDLVRQRIASAEEILYYFEQASGKRTTKATMKNSTSSRSHFVFRIDILGERDGDRFLGHLYFIDLAGSEALDASHNEKQKAEGTSIRNSLTALKTFLVRSANNERGDARTTIICQYMQYILSRSESKLLIIANIAAHDKAFSQTKDALEFVAGISKLKKCKTPGYEAAKKAAASHDKSISDQSKPWKTKKSST
jgi:kinesin family protein C1